MYHVFVANHPITEGAPLPAGTVVIDSTADAEDAYMTMSNVQYTLPCHCTVGVSGYGITGEAIVVYAVSGLNRTFRG